MKTPNALSQKGWKLYSIGNTLSSYSCLLIVFTLIVAALIMLGAKLEFAVIAIFAVIIIAFNVLAMVAIFVGRLLHWKGITLLLSAGAAQLTDTIVMQDLSVEEIKE